jgi:hypothetical protein
MILIAKKNLDLEELGRKFEREKDGDTEKSRAQRCFLLSCTLVGGNPGRELYLVRIRPTDSVMRVHQPARGCISRPMYRRATGHGTLYQGPPSLLTLARASEAPLAEGFLSDRSSSNFFFIYFFFSVFFQIWIILNFEQI